MVRELRTSHHFVRLRLILHRKTFMQNLLRVGAYRRSNMHTTVPSYCSAKGHNFSQVYVTDRRAIEKVDREPQAVEGPKLGPSLR